MADGRLAQGSQPTVHGPNPPATCLCKARELKLFSTDDHVSLMMGNTNFEPTKQNVISPPQIIPSFSLVDLCYKEVYSIITIH